MTDQRLIEIEQLARQYGSPNCWTGTTGTLAAVIIELLVEVTRLRKVILNLHRIPEIPEGVLEIPEGVFRNEADEKWFDMKVASLKQEWMDKLEGKQ